MIRLDLDISERMEHKLHHLAYLLNEDIAGVFRKGIALMQIAVEAKENGDKLMIFDEDNNPVTEIVGI